MSSDDNVTTDRSIVTAVISGIVFLIYVNAPTVLVQQLGLPQLVGAVVLLPLVAIVAYRVFVRGEALLFPAFIIAALIMLVFHSASALLSIRPYVGLGEVSEWLTEGVFVALLIVNCVRTREEVYAAARAIVAAGAVMGFIVILAQILGPTENGMFGFAQLSAVELDEFDQVVRARLAGPIGEVNRFSQIMAVLIPVAAGLAFASRGRQRWLYWAATLLICGGLALTYSRGTLVGVVLVVPFALLFGFMRLRQLVAIVVCCALLIPMSPYLTKRVVSIGEVAMQSLGLTAGGFRNADGAARGRATAMKAAGLMFLDYPLMGVGPGMAQEYYQEYAVKVGGRPRAETRRTHSLYPQLAAETGVIGLTAFLVMLAILLLPLDRARRHLQESDRQAWALVCGIELAVLTLLTTSLFLHAAYIRYFWLLLALAAAATSMTRRAAMSNEHLPTRPTVGGRIGTPA